MSATPHLQPGDLERRRDLRSVYVRECAFVSEEIEAYALGALDADESARVERHISSCPRCARHLEQAASVTSLLPFLAAPVGVPTTALTGIFARIERDQSTPDQPLPTLNPWEADQPMRSWTIPSSQEAYAAARPNASLTAAGLATRKRRLNWEVWAAPLAAMPLVLALAIVGGWAMNTRSNLQDQKSAMQVVKKENQQLSAQLLTFPSATMAAADANQADFSLDSVNSSTAGGALKQLSDSKVVTVEVWNLPSGVNACQIELEGMDGRRTNAGTMTINGSGSGNGTYSLALPLSAYRTVHVMPVIRSGNSSAPPTELLMAQINANLGDAGGTAADARLR